MSERGVDLCKFFFFFNEDKSKTLFFFFFNCVERIELKILKPVKINLKKQLEGGGRISKHDHLLVFLCSKEKSFHLTGKIE